MVALRALILCFSHPPCTQALYGPVTPSTIVGQVPAGPILLQEIFGVSGAKRVGVLLHPHFGMDFHTFRLHTVFPAQPGPLSLMVDSCLMVRIL